MSRPASSRWIAFPTSVEPVNATLSIPSARTRWAPVEPSPVTMLTTPGWHLRLAADVGEQQRRERGRLGRLQHDRVPARERGRDLPGEHEEREVPGDDLRRNAERPRAPSGERVLELVRPPRVVEEVRRCEREIDVARLLDRLAAVERLGNRELAGALLQDPRDPEQHLRALGRLPGAPRLESLARGVDRERDVLRPGLRDLGERLLRRGRDRREPRARPRGDLLTADEEAVPLLERDDVARLGRGRVLPGACRGQRAALLRDGSHQSSVISSGER